jgi:pSer/pThr/pTyr-binding forkhead associated (FHA) protein
MIMATQLILRALTGTLRGQKFMFCAPATCVLGRAPTCQLCLPDDGTVSRQHCLVELEGESAWVRDLGGRNGTHLNGEKIGQREPERPADGTVVTQMRQELQDGDELRICHHVFAVLLLDRPPEEVIPSEE